MHPQAGMIGQPSGQAVSLALGMRYPLHLGRGVAPGGEGALFAAADNLQLLAEVDLDHLALQIEGLLTNQLRTFGQIVPDLPSLYLGQDLDHLLRGLGANGTLIPGNGAKPVTLGVTQALPQFVTGLVLKLFHLLLNHQPGSLHFLPSPGLPGTFLPFFRRHTPVGYDQGLAEGIEVATRIADLPPVTSPGFCRDIGRLP